MIGLSSSYHAMNGCSIYEAVSRAVDMGFDTVELGAAHTFEENSAILPRKIRREFPNVSFTIHTLFPPLKERAWFNPANGLTQVNMAIVDGLFEAAEEVEARIVSLHPAVFNEVTIGHASDGKCYKPVVGGPINVEDGRKKFVELLGYANDRARATGTKLIVENMDAMFPDVYPQTKDEFMEVFKSFDGIGMLLDVGHALQRGNLGEMLALDGYIEEMHLHDVALTANGATKGHFPIKDIDYFKPFNGLRNMESMVLVFEHGPNVSQEEILEEKELLETFLAGQINASPACARSPLAV
ncbi:MAG: TIM barrel protein [Nitrospirae bacterium]|nr:TIM barrel protein [Nitrospirota bacterium]